jgi:hypothetical protein
MSDSGAASTKSDLEAIKHLLDEFGKLPVQAGKAPTFMEIAGYPHYENVCSNILAFFLDSSRKHGLGTLVLDALMGAVGVLDLGQDLGGNVTVEREVYTDSGNRIDLLIESDTHVIVIENKLLAGVDNPFEDYAEFASHRGTQGVTRVKVLLSLYPTEEGSAWGFYNLTYPEFVGRIRTRLGHHTSSADTRYLTLLIDFLNTLDNLQEGTSMNHDFVNLLSERQQDVEALLSDLRDFKGELRRKVQELQTLIDTSQHHNVTQRLYRESTALSDDLAHDITLPGNLTVVIDTYVEPWGWYINIWPRKGDPTTPKALLERLEIPFEQETHLDFNHQETFDYDEDLERLRSTVQDLVDTLASAHVEDPGR